MTSTIINTIIDECRKFSVKEIRPVALGADLTPDTGQVRRIWEKSGQMDLPMLTVPEISSGGGCSLLECALVLETLAAECAGVASVFAHHFCACIPLLMAHADLQKTWFSKFIDPKPSPQKYSPWLASLILPWETNSNGLHWTEAEGQFILDGKSPISGSVSLADRFIVFPSEIDHPENVLCAFIDRSLTGIALGEMLQLPGLKINPFGSMLFNNVRISPAHIIAGGAPAQKMLAAARSTFYGFTAAMAMGAARRAFEKAYDYAKERYQFGKKIIFHQEIQRMLGDMSTMLTAGTSAYRQAFDDQKQNTCTTSTNAVPAKIFCTDAAMGIALDAIQIHGGYGYMHDHGLEKIMRDIKVLQLLGGSNPFLKVRYISGNLA